MICHRIGRPPISTIGLSLIVVSSEMREPNPPASMTTFMIFLKEVGERNQSAKAHIPPTTLSSRRHNVLLQQRRFRLDRSQSTAGPFFDKIRAHHPKHNTKSL